MKKRINVDPVGLGMNFMVNFTKLSPFSLVDLLTIKILSTEDSSDDLCDVEIENSRKIKAKKFNLLMKLEEYVVENPEMFKINHVNNA